MIAVWVAVDEDAVASAGAAVLDAAALLESLDLRPVSTAVVEGMPGSRSAAGSSIVAEVVADLQAQVVDALTAVRLESGRLRLAAEQYAAADLVAGRG
ncbi:MAG: hypothetical protein ABJA89_13795 [Lapillicoccus sp.]